MELRSYRSLEVWKKSMTLAEAVYHLSEDWPSDEKFGLISQIRRAAVSVPANIAEGYGRLHRGDYVRHLSMAQGSVAEIETLLALAARLKVASRREALLTWHAAQEVGRLLRRLIESLRGNS